MKQGRSEGDPADGQPSKRRRIGASDASAAAISSGNVGSESLYSIVSHSAIDRYGRRMYLAMETDDIQKWISADALPLKLVLEFENASSITGALAVCKNPGCTRTLKRNASSKYCSPECGMEAARKVLARSLAQHKNPVDGAGLSAPLPSSFVPAVEVEPSARKESDVSWLEHINDQCKSLRDENERLTRLLDECNAQLTVLHGESRVECDPKVVDAAIEFMKEGSRKGSNFYQCPLCLKSLPPVGFLKHVSACNESVCRQTLTPLMMILLLFLTYLFLCLCFFQSKRRGLILESEEPLEESEEGLYCGAAITTRKRTLYCRRLKASCPLHGGPLCPSRNGGKDAEAAAAAATGESDVADASARNRVYQCGFVDESGEPCHIPEDYCPFHYHWRAYRDAELQQGVIRTNRCIAANVERLIRLEAQLAFATKKSGDDDSEAMK